MLQFEEVKETFAFFDDWEDRYRYILDLGKSLPDLPDHLRTEENLVHGCQSLVWISMSYDVQSNQVKIQLDSDAFIVRGLIAILLTLFQNQSPDHIVELELESIFADLDLISHLSPTRGNGLRSMVQRIKQEAKNIGAQEPN